MARPRSTIDGYVADSLYPSSFHPQFAPTQTSAMLVHAGVRPPCEARAPFAFVDLGCGDGLGMLALAAAHPEGRFLGLDAMPEHVARGSKIATELGLANAELQCATFQLALDSVEPASADYVACQGVLAWVSPENQKAVMALAARLLKPGGALTIGYNSFPGWGQIAPFQRTVRAVAQAKRGSPTKRFNAAISSLRKAKAIDPAIWSWFDPLWERLPHDYFAHEYLNAHWQPLWADEAMALAGAHGLALVADATPWRLREDFALRKAWRETLAGIADPLARETARDVLTNSWFRTDIYVKGPPIALGPRKQRAALMEQVWRSTCPANAAVFEASTPAGTIRFANDAARAIMAQLDQGPAPLGSVASIRADDLLNTIDALFMAGLVIPVAPTIRTSTAQAFNQWVASQPDLNMLAGRNGAIRIERGEAKAIKAKALKRAGLQRFILLDGFEQRAE
jgi:SAM-dependent methyltransferase